MADDAVATDAELSTNARTSEAPAKGSPHDTIAHQHLSPLRLGGALGLVMLAAMSGLLGWLGFYSYRSGQDADQRTLYLQTGKQEALNLTTIDYTRVDADIQRILESSTGMFYDDFQKRSKPFVEVVKRAQSKSEGTITEAGLESAQGDQAQVLVAISVKMSDAGAADQQPRAWRMRLSVLKIGDGAKVSNVEFVP